MEKNENDLYVEITKFEITATTQHAANLKGTENYGRKKTSPMPTLKQQTKPAAVQQRNLAVIQQNEIKTATETNRMLMPATIIAIEEQLNDVVVPTGVFTATGLFHMENMHRSKEGTQDCVSWHMITNDTSVL